MHRCTYIRTQRRSLPGLSCIFQPQKRCLTNQHSDKPSHQDAMSPACPTKHCTPSELPENGFCKMKVCLKLLVENSISRSVSRQKILNMLGNEHIQLHLPCIILHKYWIWGLDSVFVGGLEKKKKRKTSWSWEKDGRQRDGPSHTYCSYKWNPLLECKALAEKGRHPLVLIGLFPVTASSKFHPIPFQASFCTSLMKNSLSSWSKISASHVLAESLRKREGQKPEYFQRLECWLAGNTL